MPNCHRVGDRGFKRKDNLLQHRRLLHQEDIPKVRVRFGSGGVRAVRVEGDGPA